MSLGNHRFEIGEIVDFRAGFAGAASAQGSYEIVRQLPADGNINQYHIKNVRDGQQRIAREDQLTPSSLQKAHKMFAKG